MAGVNHGTAFASRHKLARGRVEAMKVIWIESRAEYHSEFVNFEPMMAWPKPVQKPHPPVIVAAPSRTAYGGPCAAANGRMPHRSRAQYADVQPCCRSSARWRLRRAAISRRYRSRSGARRRIWTYSSATATTVSHAWSSASIPTREIRCCRRSIARRI
ncbi:LLM class flavin-dependent oxidoreductase [Bradyrhizobium lablabi]|nr:LLM class flavin-dependent oxidoreductase [Bradyrhizobium lablabi]